MSDPLDAVLVSVDPMQLATWQEAGGESADSVETDEDQQTSSRDAPFPIDAGINSKLVLWSGDLATLKATAIVNVSNETMSDRNPLSVRILDLGGPALQQEVAESVRSCRTGEAKVTKGYRLPARFIIHTIGPRYNAKYRTAAESALYNSTRAVLEQVLDRGLDTLGLAPIHSIKRGYPPEEGAHLILRCLRRFLERHGDGLSRLVLATSDQNGACYPELAALYFPRRPAELRQSKIALAGANLGGLMGEPVHQGRGIRIAANPLGEQRDCSRESSPSPPPSEAAMGDQIETAVAATASVLAGYGAEQDSGLAVSGVGSHAFARMEQNPDSDASRWQKRVGSSSGGGGAGGVGKGAGGSGRVNAGGRRQSADVIRADQVLSSERRYDRWLRRARQQDLSRLRAARCLFHSGHDVHGRPVIVVIGSGCRHWLSATTKIWLC
ncbi:hypothetical protein BOX15_Mlig031796g1 [Macrostomum lignano]|uniref:Macro domain-containing protein n=1 Tax=Macrostomum lignano TaxID=282301 RepID=A0A267EKH4_9PLAT|nr:hypothetical protein BOX15_Mlig031796g1 [Macrostomum lignano]